MTDGRAVAIVGMSCWFPGARGLEAFWRCVHDGGVELRDVPLDRWDHAAFHSRNPRDAEMTYARKIACLDDLRSFAPEWYGLPPRRVRPMDPQQRLILDQVRLALDDAGYGGRPLPRSTGVYVGASVAEYKDLVVSRLRARQILGGQWGHLPPLPAGAVEAAVRDVASVQPYSMIGLLLNMIACNVSQAFDLGGPSLVMDSACSSALVAVHEAVLHLRAGICDAAIVGGVYTMCTPDLLVGFSRIGALSKSDACRPFDEGADGFVLGEGVGAVVLKRLDDAVRDGDRVWAVVRGVGLNNDGRGEGPMTPRVGGQLDALARAYRDAAVAPDTVGYVEAHGTATPVGDLTEMAALKANAGANGDGAVQCAVASVKGNFGHALAAAGIAGLVKAVLVLDRRTIPPQAGLQSPRAALALEGSGFDVPTVPRPFVARRGLPRRAGVSAFGFGGTNVHVILEEPPRPERSRTVVGVPDRGQPELFVVSAPTPPLLAEHLEALADAVADTPAPLSDLAYTLTATRRREAARVAFVARDRVHLREQLRGAVAAVRGEPVESIVYAPEPRLEDRRRIAFLCPGQGVQAPGLCLDLYRRFPAFRARLEALAAPLDGVLERPLLAYLYPSERGGPAGSAAARAELIRTEVCQPVLAALELALVDFVAGLGLRPHATIGHSLGEFVAAAVGGILEPEAALRLAAERGRLIAALPLEDPGAMAAVAASPEVVARLLPQAPGVVAANVNAPQQVVVSGPTAAVEAFIEDVRRQGIRANRLGVSHAFHSPLMNGVGEALSAYVGGLRLSAARIPVISCAVPGPYPADREAIARVFVQHATARVDFVRGILALHRAGADVFVQVGPGRVLLDLARATLTASGFEPIRCITLAESEGDRGASLLGALGELAVLGVPLELASLFEGARPVSLPSAPLRTRRFWVVADRERADGFEGAPLVRPEEASMGVHKEQGGESEIMTLVEQQMAVLEAQMGLIRRQADLLRVRLGGEKAERPLVLPASLPAATSVNGAHGGERRSRPATDRSEDVRARDAAPAVADAPPDPKDSVRQRVMDLVSQVSALPAGGVRPGQRLSADLGFDSLMGVDLYVRLTEAFPEARDLPRSLIGGETTVEDLVGSVAAAVGRSQDAVAEGTASRPIQRYVVVAADRPLPAPPPGRDLPFAGPVRVVADTLGVAALLARRLRDAGRVATIVSPSDALTADGARAVIDMSALGSEGPATADPAGWRDPVLTALARAASLATAPAGPAAFVVVHPGGRHAGLAGLAKSLAHEWPKALVRSVEIDTDAGAATIADTVFEELRGTDQTVEVSYATGCRRAPALERRSIETRALPDRAVVAIAGGGRGLGSLLAVELARRYRARLLLLGRAEDAPAVTQAIRDAGGAALYARCDVRDLAQVQAAFRRCHDVFGPIDAVVHAAGILGDGPVASGDDDRRRAVFDTKIAGALALWQAAEPYPLRVFLMYGSWAGRFGNAHQAAYAAANHALGRLADLLGAERPRTRVVTLDLPPWEGSTMVRELPEPVARALRGRAPFLDDEVGLARVLAELGAEAASEEVVLGVDLEAESRVDRAAVSVSSAARPWLADHRIEAQIVLPLAVGLDDAAAAARRVGLGPALSLSRVDVLEALVVPDEGATRLVVTAQRDRGGVDARIDLSGGGGPRPWMRLLATTAPAPLPALVVPPGGVAPTLSLDEFYGRWTFHGPRLRALVSVLDVGERHATALVRAADGDGPGGAVLDVLSLDAMLQLCAYWAALNVGRIGLPTGADEVRVLARPRSGEQSRVVGLLRGVSDEGLTGDLDLLDDAGRPLVQVRGVRCRFAMPARESRGAPVGSGAAESTLNPASWRIEDFPEVQALHQRLEMAQVAGIENPYFSVHERVTNDTSIIGGREYVNFASYNYLGLSGDPDVTEAALDAVRRYGTSVSASRLASGEKPLHRELEGEIADFLGCEDAIVMVGGHATNVSVIGHLFGPQDLVLHDGLAHDSILGGIRLAGAKRRPFPHNDVEALDRLLGELRGSARRVLIAVEGVYSMDGDVAPLAQIVEIKRRHRALLLVDEAHSLGVLGATGRGVGEHFGVDRRNVDLWMGTLSKALASCGGYIAGSSALVQYLKYSNPGFVYSVGISPANAAAALAALRVLRARPELVATLRERSRAFLDACRRRGVDTGLSEGSAVIPAIVGNSWDCLRLSRALASRHINVQPILYPAVEDAQARLRFFVTARHSEAQLHAAADALAEELEAIDPKYLRRRLPAEAGAPTLQRS